MGVSSTQIIKWSIAMKIELIDFSRLKANFSRLIEYGFKRHHDDYQYQTQFKKHNFSLLVSVSIQGVVDTLVKDMGSDEVYTLHINPTATGQFIGEIREEYKRILLDIAKTCFEPNIFNSDQAKLVIQYFKDKYSVELEYLWKKMPNNAIARRQDNNKWFAALLTVDRAKLGFEESGDIEILNLKMSPADKNIISDNKKFLPAYHMNKQHWYSIRLDGRVNTHEILEKIDISFNLVSS